MEDLFHAWAMLVGRCGWRGGIDPRTGAAGAVVPVGAGRKKAEGRDVHRGIMGKVCEPVAEGVAEQQEVILRLL